MLAPNDTKVDLIVNKLTEDQFNQLSAEGRLNENQLWVVTDDQYMVLGRPAAVSMEDHTIEPVVYPSNFTFIALEANSTVKMMSSGGPSVSLEYSTDNGTTWNTFTVGSTTVTLANIDDMVQFRAASTNSAFASSYNSSFNHWVLTGQLKVVGDFRTLYSKDGWSSLTNASNYACVRMFDNCTALYDAHDLNMGFSYWDTNAAARIFQGCTNLKRGPYLKNTNTGSYALEYFFNGCTSLKEITLDMENSTGWNTSTFQLWVQSVPSGGTIYTQRTSPGSGSSYFPYGWTIKTLTQRPVVEGTPIQVSHELSSLVFNRLSRSTYNSLSSVDPDQIWFLQEEDLSGQPIVVDTTPRATKLSELQNDVPYLSEVSWSQVTGKPTIPTNTSQLTNDSGYCTSAYVNQKQTIWVDWTVYDENGLKFTATQSNSTISLSRTSNAPQVSLECSLDDGATWSSFVPGSTTITLQNEGDSMLLRAGSGGNTRFASSTSDYHTFSITGKVSVSGSIMFLLDQNGSETATMGEYCFTNLFYQCAAIVSAPRLPSPNVTQYCYYSMFTSCTSLTTGPEVLPATTLAQYCYGEMLNQTAITKAPYIKATTLAENCFRGMFYGCTSLGEIKLDYTGRFFGSEVPSNAFYWWNWNLPSGGTLYYNGVDRSTGVSGVPFGWSVYSF